MCGRHSGIERFVFDEFWSRMVVLEREGSGEYRGLCWRERGVDSREGCVGNSTEWGVYIGLCCRDRGVERFVREDRVVRSRESRVEVMGRVEW